MPHVSTLFGLGHRKYDFTGRGNRNHSFAMWRNFSSCELQNRQVENLPHSTSFEKLNRFLVFLRGGLGCECAKISTFPSLRIFFPRVQPVFARSEFPDHK